MTDSTRVTYVWLCRLCLCSFAGLCPVLIVSVPFHGCVCVALFPVCSRRGVVVIGLLLRDQHTLAVKVLNEHGFPAVHTHTLCACLD